jgi:DNA polymerase elongation subunit (family B)
MGPKCLFRHTLLQKRTIRDDGKNIKNHISRHLSEGVPLAINYEQFKPEFMPSRDHKRVMEPKLKRVVASYVERGDEILFHPNAHAEGPQYNEPVIYLFGVLPCGSRACVILRDIPIYTQVRCRDGDKPDRFASTLKRLYEHEHGGKIKCYKIVQEYDYRGWRNSPVPYVEYEFTTLKERAAFLTWAHKQGEGTDKHLVTAFDDNIQIGQHYHVVARDYRFNSSKWNAIAQYAATVRRCPKTGDPLNKDHSIRNCDYVITCKPSDLRPLEDELYRKYAAPEHPFSNAVERDPTLVMSWDIETHCDDESGGIPDETSEYTIFMMCGALFHHHNSKPLLTWCFVIGDCQAREGIDITVRCRNETDLITGFTDMLGLVRADMYLAFNGCDFDWQLYREKLKRLNLLQHFFERVSCLTASAMGCRNPTAEWIHRTLWRTNVSIKISAGNDRVVKCLATVPGVLDTDAMIMCMREWPRAETGNKFGGSLNHYLSVVGLESKYDMPYKRMFRIYERARMIMRLSAQGSKKKNIRAEDTIEGSTSTLVCAPNDAHNGTTNGTSNGENKACNPMFTCHCAARCQVCKGNDPHFAILDYDDTTKRRWSKCCACELMQLTSWDMSEVAYYCVIDSIRPQQLYCRITTLTKARDIANLSYVSTHAAFYRAGGMRVRNLIASECRKYGMAYPGWIPNRDDHEKEHFPGGWVFPPNRGMHSDMPLEVRLADGTRVTIQPRPIFGDDFASLYPSLQMAYNISPDMVVYTREEADKLTALGYTLHHVGPFEYEVGKDKHGKDNIKMRGEGWFVRHNNVFEFEGEHNIVCGFVKQVSYKCVKCTACDAFKAERRLPCKHKLPLLECKECNKCEHEVPLEDCNKCSKCTHKAPERSERSFSYDENTDNTEPTKSQVLASVEALEAAEWEVTRRVSYRNIEGRKRLPNERMGIFPFVVKKVFDRRVPVKHQLEELGECIEDLKSSKEASKVYTINGITRSYTLAELEFLRDRATSVSLALKVMCNTFYGESGNFRSSIYELLVAAGTTIAGQGNVKGVADFVTKQDFRVHYGDTDSVYIACGDTYFTECDAKHAEALARINEQFRGVANVPNPRPGTREAEYKLARVEARRVWWTEMVKITMRAAQVLTEQIFDYLLASNGTLFLKMAYEEVCYPTVLCGKKKYFAKAHEKKVNFDITRDKDVFVRGIEVVKQGQSRVAREIGYALMREVLKITNEQSLLTVAENMFREFLLREHKLEDFVIHGAFKPDKKNMAMHRFHRRMQDIHDRYVREGNLSLAHLYSPPTPSDKFQYVVVQPKRAFDITGKKISVGKGDKMEYLTVYKHWAASEERLDIDMRFYADKSIAGILARFIANDKRFEPEDAAMMDYEKYDKATVKRARAYLMSKIAGILGIDDSAALREKGSRHRAGFRELVKLVNATIETGPLHQYKQYLAIAAKTHCAEWGNLHAEDTDSQILGKLVLAASAHSETAEQCMRCSPVVQIEGKHSRALSRSIAELDAAALKSLDAIQVMSHLPQIYKRYHARLVKAAGELQDKRESGTGDMSKICADYAARILEFEPHEITVLQKYVDCCMRLVGIKFMAHCLREHVAIKQ